MSTPPRSLPRLRSDLLAARDAREALVQRLARRGTLVFAGTNVPGADKAPEGLAELFDEAIARLAGMGRPEAALLASVVAEGVDAAGPFALLASALAPHDAKRAAVKFEESVPAGRLLDLDVYDESGRQVDRASLGLAPRRCLVCPAPALDCIRTGRHTPEDLGAAVRSLLAR